jgi:ArsR family transcriptional regulator
MDPAASQVWQVVREQLIETTAARRDAERAKTVIGARRLRSRDFFSSTAGQWDRVRNDLFGPGVEWRALAGLIDPSWTVADLGTGTGQLAAVLSPLVSQVIAVDELPSMLAAAEERTRGCPNVDRRQGSLESLPIESGFLDLVFIVLVLHHLPEPRRAVREAGRVLKHTGRLVMIDMVPHERSDYRETMGHQWLGFDEPTVASWLRAAGLGRGSYRLLPHRPDAEGPGLFIATATKLDHAPPQLAEEITT